MSASPQPVSGTRSGESLLFLNWLVHPSKDRGIHVYESGEWVFHSYAGIAATARGLAARLRTEPVGSERTVIAVLSEHAPTVLASFGAAWLLKGVAQVLPQPLTFQQRSRYGARVEHITRLTGCGYIGHDRTAGGEA
jgi:long-subunit acyl-CoA synthetase (AMP-forming)